MGHTTSQQRKKGKTNLLSDIASGVVFRAAFRRGTTYIKYDRQRKLLGRNAKSANLGEKRERKEIDVNGKTHFLG